MSMVKKTQFVKDLRVKEDVNTPMLVKFISLMQARDGRNYLNAVLADSSGDIECRAWTKASELSNKVKKGSFVRCLGKVNFYQGRKQIILDDLEVLANEEVEKEDYILKAQSNPEEMFAELTKIVSELDDYYIRELLQNILNDTELARRIKLWPAGKTIHHAYQSGLLEHILSVTKLALFCSEQYKVNRNYVVAGAILHDFCKVYELTDGVNVEYTEEGKLVGHLVKAVELVDRFSYRIKNFPYDLKLHLKHILLSHHGEYEYGSPKIPQTSEAMLVHLIDLMDSKMHSFTTIKMTDNQEGHWSNFVKHLDRIVYKKELPYYPEALSDDYREAKSAAPAAGNKKVKRTPKDPKTSMGDLLKTYKVD